MNPFESSWDDSQSIRGETISDAIFSLNRLDHKTLYNKKASTKAGFSYFTVKDSFLVVSKTDGQLLRTTTDGMGEVDEIDLTRRGVDDAIDKVFFSDDGLTCIVSMKSDDNYVLMGKSFRPRKLSKMTGKIQSVAFGFNSKLEVILLIGTNTGRIYEFLIDISGKEKFCTQVYQDEAFLPITSIYFKSFESSLEHENKYFAFFTLSSPIRIYYHFGGPTFQQLFSKNTATEFHSFTEFPGESMPNSPIILENFNYLMMSLSFTVPSKFGIYCGCFLFNKSGSSVSDVTVEAQFVPFSFSSEAILKEIASVSTMYHYLLLCSDRLLAISLLSGEIIQEIKIKKDSDGMPLSLVKDSDSGKVWMLTDSHIYKIDSVAENRFVWAIYLNKARETGDDNCFLTAISNAVNNSQVAEIIRKQSQYYQSKTAFEKAAMCFSRIKQRFDDSVLSLLHLHYTLLNQENLTQSNNGNILQASNLECIRLYLLDVLKSLPNHRKSQKTMISTWLIDIILYQLSSFSISSESKADLTTAFKEYLRLYRSSLDPATTFNLIISRNQKSLLLFYAQIVGDYSRVVNFYLNESRHIDIVNIFRDAPLERIESILFKVSPLLVEYEPEATFGMLARQRVSIVQILPTLLRYCSLLDKQNSSPVKSSFPLDVDFEGLQVNFSVKYLEDLFRNMSSERLTDASVIHTLLSLVAKYDSTSESNIIWLLEAVIAQLKDSTIANLDRRFIVSECKRWNRKKSLVYAYIMLNLEEKAVTQAISVDISLAKKIASQCSSPSKSKILWLKIARFILDRDTDTIAVLQLLRESNNAILIEDLLPLLPDFTMIDSFKQEICKTLEDSGERIDQLKNEMNELSESSEAISKELEGMKRRGYTATNTQRCDSCSDHLFSRPFYLFPCSHGFHVDCLMSRALKACSDSKLVAIKSLDDQIKALQAKKNASEKKNLAVLEMLQNEIDSYIAADCPECGYAMIESLSIPLITSDDEIEAHSWQIN